MNITSANNLVYNEYAISAGFGEPIKNIPTDIRNSISSPTSDGADKLQAFINQNVSSLKYKDITDQDSVLRMSYLLSPQMNKLKVHLASVKNKSIKADNLTKLQKEKKITCIYSLLLDSFQYFRSDSRFGYRQKLNKY